MKTENFVEKTPATPLNTFVTGTCHPYNEGIVVYWSNTRRQNYSHIDYAPSMLFTRVYPCGTGSTSQIGSQTAHPDLPHDISRGRVQLSRVHFINGITAPQEPQGLLLLSALRRAGGVMITFFAGQKTEVDARLSPRLGYT